MDYIFLVFAAILGVAGLIFAGYYIYRLMKTPEVGPKMRAFNRLFLGLVALGIIAGLFMALFGEGKIGLWGQVQAAGLLALALWIMAAEGFGVGFQQMEQDGVGFIRFFQLGSSVLLCYSLAPAFYAFITFGSNFA